MEGFVGMMQKLELSALFPLLEKEKGA